MFLGEVQHYLFPVLSQNNSIASNDTCFLITINRYSFQGQFLCNLRQTNSFTQERPNVSKISDYLCNIFMVVSYEKVPTQIQILELFNNRELTCDKDVSVSKHHLSMYCLCSDDHDF